MRLIQSAWFVAAGLSGLISTALPIVCNADTQGTSSTQLQHQIVDNLAKGKDVKELIAQVKSLPANNTAIGTRHEAAADLQQQLSDFQKILRGAGSADAVAPGTLSSIADAYQVLQANHLLFKLHFADIKQTLAEAGVSSTFEARRQLAEDNYDQTYKGLTEILDPTLGAVLSSSDRAKLLADSAIQRAAQDAIRKAGKYLDVTISRPSSPILRGSTLLPYRQATLAQRQPLLSPVIQPSYLNATDQASPPQPEDSVASLDAPLTDEILLQAKSLGYDYIRIYEFVRNNIRTQWYAGAMKGAVGTLRQKSGNDIDQASLLIALFRASGLSARYIHGVVELPIEDVMNSLGVADITQTTTALTRAGVAYSVVIRGGRIAAVNVEHTWVSAYVPYTNYRGATVDASGATWLPLTPALKAYQLNLPTNIYGIAGFKADTLIGDYLQQPQDADLLSVLRKQVGDYLQAQGKGASYVQQLGSTTIAPKTLGLLPNTLPVNVIAVTGEEAVLADNYRQQIRFIVRQGTGDADKVILDYSVPMSVVQNERVTLSYIPATVDDQKTVDRFGGLDYTPAYLIKLRAQIKINGQQKAVAQDALDAGTQHRFEVVATSPNGKERVAQTVLAGAYHAVGIYAQQVARVIPDSDPADTEYLAAKLLDSVAYQYVDKWDSAEQEFASLMNVAVVHPWPTIVLVSNSLQVDNVLGRPMQLHWKGVTLDAALRIAEPVSRTSIMTQLKDWMQLTALQGSVLEHQMFESLYAVDSMSADKGLALARAGGIPVLSINSANSSALLPTLTLSADVIDDIANWLRQGMTVEVPRDPITYKAWQGAVWRVIDPNTGAAGYFISGGLAGGSSAQSGWILEWLAEALAAANTAQANTDPLSGAYISVIDGDSQQGEVGTTLPSPLSVLVLDSKGRPVIGAKVTFGATSGEGQLTSETGKSASVVAYTNFLGVATVQFELGKETLKSPVYVSAPGDKYSTRAGLNYVDANVATYSGPLALTKPFQAYGLPGQPVKLQRTSGCCVGSPLPDYTFDVVNVQAQDQYNNSISNVDVNFNLMQITPSSKGGSNGKLIGTCSGCEGLSVEDTTSASGTSVAVNLGSGYNTYTLVATAAAGTYTGQYTMSEPEITVTFMAIVDEFGHNIAATKVGKAFPTPLVGGLYKFDSDARAYFPIGYENISSEITNGGSVSQPASISANEWQVSATAGSSPGLNVVTFTATKVPGVGIGGGEGTVRWGILGIYGVSPKITGVEGPGTEGGAVPLNEDGLTQGPVSVKYSVLPTEYYSLGTDMDVFKDGSFDTYSVGTSRTGDGTALLVRDQPFVLNQAYTAQLVLNRGTNLEVKSDTFKLPMRQKIFKDYSRSLSVSQDIDTLNQRVCSLATSFFFTLSQPARITLIATDQDNPNAHTTLISDKSYPKGESSEVFLPSDLTPGKYSFELTGVSDIDGHSETVKGGALSEMVVRNALPIGHVTVKGVDLKDGHLFMGSTDLSIPGRGVPLEFRRSYSSSASYQPAELGMRWSHNYDSKVIINQCQEVIVIGGEGGGMRFVDDGKGGLKPLKGYHGTLIPNHTDHTFDFYSKDGTRYHYQMYGGRAQWDLEFIQDTNGNVTKLAYDPTSGKIAKLLTVEDSAGRTLKFKYDYRFFGMLHIMAYAITEVDGPDGMAVTYEYDDYGNLIKASRADATRVESYGYSDPTGPIVASQVLTSYTNPGNVTSKYSYNAGNVTVTPQGGGVLLLLPNSYVTAVQDGAQSSTQFTYGSDWQSATVTNANGNVTSYAFNQYGSPLSITDPAGTTSMTWSADDIVMNSKTNGRGVTTNYTYDLNANLLSESVGGGTTTYTYATFPPTLPIKNRVASKTDRNGNATTYSYDGSGNLLSQADAAGVTHHSYAGNGDRLQTTDPRGNSTRFTYDTYGYLETVVDAMGGTTQTPHNIRGQLVGVTNANHYSTTMGYDNLNRLLGKIDPLGGSRTYTYDNMGNKLSEKDEEGRTTAWTYDDQNRVTSIQNAGGKTKTFGYDPEGNKTSESDWDSNTTSYSYDGANRLTTRTEPLGKVTAYGYDPVGNVTSETDALGRVTSYAYDPMNRRTSKADAMGGSTKYGYDAVGNKLSETDPLSHSTSFNYDGVNRLVSATNALGGTTQYRYDANGNRTAEIDAHNHTKSFTYDALNRLSKSTDANGHDTNWVYDAMGNVITEINARLFKTSHQYDGLNRRTQTTDPANAVTGYTYDKVGNRTGETWPNGNAVSNAYDALNRLTSSNDSLGALAAYTYDANGNRTSETDARGNTTGKSYDALYRLTQVAMPEGRTVKYGYDLMGNKTSETDARNNATQFGYDALNRLKTVIDPKQQTIAYDYDAVGNKLSETDKRGNATTYAYDALNRLTSATDPLGNATHATYDAVGNKVSDIDKRGTATAYTYDPVNRLLSTTKAGVTLQTQQYDEVGNVKFKTDANGNVSTYIYDGRNLLLTESRPLAAITNYQYDSIGNRTRMEDPEHRTTTWAYDQRRRNTSETNGASETTTYTYDENGNRTSDQRPKGNTWTSVYDKANRLTSITDPLSGATSYSYDANNNRLSQTDANGNKTSYEYDVLNRQTAMTYADGAHVSFGYDANGNRTSLTDAKGQSFSYAFDALNRNTQMSYPMPAASTGDDLQTIGNGYDANGNLIQVTESYSGPSGTRNTARSYDSFDRLTSVTDGFNKTLHYVYDANGNRTMLTDPDNNVTRYGFDELNRVNTVTNTGGTTTYAYDRSSLKTKVGYPNGTNAATTYDHAKRILTLVNRQGAAPVSSYSYTYDANGNRTQQVENNGGTDETTTYAFDANDRLTTVNYPDKQTAYTFDANANRLTEVTIANSVTTLNKTYSYNNRNQLTAVTDGVTPANDAVYGFDANGNQTSKTQGATVTAYAYDVKDQLLSVSQNNANIGVFSYDYQGHRIVKDMGGAIVRYAYDGNSVLLETDNTGTTLAKFDYGPDRLLSMTHVTEGRAYYLFDALGSVSNLTNTAGAIQARYQYDAYGNYRSTAGASFNRFGFTGHEKDNETTLYYFKARYYDPDTGRFLNQDAYLGDINTPPSLHRYLYAYANPTVYIDLNGYESVFGDATEQLEHFKDWLGEQNKTSNSKLAAVAIGTAQFVSTLGEGITRPLDIAANLAQTAAGVDNQKVRDELAGTKKFVTNAADFVVNGDYGKAANNVYQAAANEAGKASNGDVTAIANLTQAALGVMTAKGGASDLATAGKSLAAKAGNALDVVSEKVANAGQAVKNVLTREGGKLEAAESLAPGVQRTVAAETSVGANSESVSLTRTDRAASLKQEGFQDHHIISDKNVLTKEHELLDLAGYDLQSRSNKIFLPTEEGLHPTRSIHYGKHLNSVSENLANQMDAVVGVGKENGWTTQQYRQALDAIVVDERALLKSGERALNKNARPWAE